MIVNKSVIIKYMFTIFSCINTLHKTLYEHNLRLLKKNVEKICKPRISWLTLSLSIISNDLR